MGSTRRMRELGVTDEMYAAMLVEQQGRCAICGEESDRPLQVDHCHRTKKKRKLLCHMCNRGLGHFRDSPWLLAEAIRYLQSA